MYNSWKDYESYTFDKESNCYINDDGDEQHWEDENGQPEDWKTKMIRIQGEESHDADYDDLYYGKTLLGWSLVKENVINDYSELIQLGVIIKI
jgi:hypothetical protein